MTVVANPQTKSFDHIVAGLPSSLIKAITAKWGKPTSDCFAVVAEQELRSVPGVGAGGIRRLSPRLAQDGVQLWPDPSTFMITRIMTNFTNGPATTPAHYYRFFVAFDVLIDELLDAMGQQYGELSFYDLVQCLEHPEAFIEDGEAALEAVGNTHWSSADILLAIFGLGRNLKMEVTPSTWSPATKAA